jgi:hypothetical protein
VRFNCSAVIRGLSIKDFARVECVLDNDEDDDDNGDVDDCCVFAVRCR